MSILYNYPTIMKKQLLLAITGMAIILCILPSCGKDETPPAPKTKTELISTGTWRFSTATVGGIDAGPLLQTCQKDNILAFVSTGTGTADEGTTKCNGGDPQTSPFTWNFTGGETVLNVSATFFTGGSGTFNIVTLSETQLVLSQTISGQVAVVTFIH